MKDAMNTLGPYIIFSSRDKSTPIQWCYFTFQPNNPSLVEYYTTPYEHADQAVQWLQSDIKEQTSIYVYDFLLKKMLCYLIDGERLLQVPLLENKDGRSMINPVYHVQSQNNKIVTPLLNGKRAAEYKVDINLYPRPRSNLNLTPPTLPITSPIISKIDTTQAISIDAAKQALQVTQCIAVSTAVKCPHTINPGCMYVWHDHGQWSFIVNYLGHITSGIFDSELDSKVIAHLNEEKEDVNLSAIRWDLSRPYINLNAYHQSCIVGKITHEWPLQDGMSSQDQIDILHAIVKDEIKGDHQTFKRHLQPSTINDLYCNDPEFTQKEIMIDTIILFINQLLQASAQLLSDPTFPAIQPVSASNDVVCHKPAYDFFWQIIINREIQDINDLSLEVLLEHSALLTDLLEPASHTQELIQLFDDLVAGIMIEENLSHQEAQEKIYTTCQNLRKKLTPWIFKQVATAPIETLQRLQQQTADHHHTWLITLLLESEVTRTYAQDNSYFLFQIDHDDLTSFLQTLWLLNTASLLTGPWAQINFDAMLQQRDIQYIAQQITALDDAGLLTQANFDLVSSPKIRLCYKILSAINAYLNSAQNKNSLSGFFNKKWMLDYARVAALRGKIITILDEPLMHTRLDVTEIEFNEIIRETLEICRSSCVDNPTSFLAQIKRQLNGDKIEDAVEKVEEFVPSINLPTP